MRKPGFLLNSSVVPEDIYFKTFSPQGPMLKKICGGGKNLRDNYRLLYGIFHIACHINPKAPRLIWVES